MSETTLRIGELARRARVGVDTIRYYEKLGLLAPAARTRSGYRSFEPGSARRLRFIRHAQELGFTLEEIGELLALRLAPGGSCDKVRARAAERLVVIEHKLAHLVSLRDALATLVAACDERQPTAECPILEALDKENGDEPHH
jgi:DNA-binding transcriptional MerR regulator